MQRVVPGGVTISDMHGLRPRPESVARVNDEVEVAVVQPSPGDERLALLWPSNTPLPARFEGETSTQGNQLLLVGPRSLDPDLFRELYAYARDVFPQARIGYHISGRLENAPAPGDVADADLPGLLDQPDARQVLHVTYGQVLTHPSLADGLLTALRTHPDVYAAILDDHFARHLKPFASVTTP